MSFFFFCFMYTLNPSTVTNRLHSKVDAEREKTAAGAGKLALLPCCCLAESVVVCKRLHQADEGVHLQHLESGKCGNMSC